MTSPSVLPDEAGYVDVREGGHQVLTVEAIHDAAVSRDGAGKVLQAEQSVRVRSLKRHETLFFLLLLLIKYFLFNGALDELKLLCSAVSNHLSQQ